MLAQSDDHIKHLAAKMVKAHASKHFQQLNKLPSTEQAQALELAIAYNRHLARKNFKDEALLRANAIQLLSARSKLPETQTFTAISPPKASDDRGHDSYQLHIAWAQQPNANQTEQYDSLDLEFRLAYHHMTDPIDGYQPGASLEMGRFHFDVSQENALKLRTASLIDIRSLSPRNEFLKPWSWRVQTGLDRYLSPKSPLFASLNGGAGVSYGLQADRWPGQWLSFALLAGDIRAGGPFKRGAALTLGPEMGVLWHHSQFNFLIQIGYYQDLTAKQASLWQSRVQFHYALAKQSQIVTQWHWERTPLYTQDTQQILAGFRWFF